jgi:hypothetical protein
VRPLAARQARLLPDEGGELVEDGLEDIGR